MVVALKILLPQFPATILLTHTYFICLQYNSPVLHAWGDYSDDYLEITRLSTFYFLLVHTKSDFYPATFFHDHIRTYGLHTGSR